MRKDAIAVLAIFLILPAMLFTVSCAKQTTEAQPTVTAAEPAPAQPAPAEPAPKAAEPSTSDADRIAAVEMARQKEMEREQKAAMNQFVNELVYFEFDSAVLSPEAQLSLSMKADFLNANSVRVTIEGHCDERGTEAYNMALGQRRADAVKAFWVDLGISEGRISTISYGEERPIDPRSNEEAWGKNRRAQFVIN